MAENTYNEAKGKGLTELQESKELHHLRIHAHEDATSESPAWTVSHHTSDDDEEPTKYHFVDGHEMIKHVAKHTNIPDDHLPPRTILPREVHNLQGRAK